MRSLFEVGQNTTNHAAGLSTFVEKDRSFVSSLGFEDRFPWNVKGGGSRGHVKIWLVVL
jgi:hypothetical protein